MEENCRVLVSSSFQKKTHLPLHVNPLFLSELCLVGTALMIITLAVKTINIWWAIRTPEGLSARFYEEKRSLLPYLSLVYWLYSVFMVVNLQS